MSLASIIERGLAKSKGQLVHLQERTEPTEVRSVIAHLVDLLVKNTDDPGRIGMRVHYLRAYLQEESGFTLAKKFGVSKQRACRAKKAMGEILSRAEGLPQKARDSGLCDIKVNE